jgi:hypothetical protein
VGRAPGVVVVLPRVCPRLDRHEAVAALLVGEASSCPREVGVERRGVPVELVGVVSRGVGLPDLDQAVSDRAAVAVQYSPRDEDSLPQGLACVLASQVVIQLPYRVAPVGAGPVVSESVLGRMMSGFFGALRRVAT